MADVDGINISPVNPAVRMVVRLMEKMKICFKPFFFYILEIILNKIWAINKYFLYISGGETP